MGWMEGRFKSYMPNLVKQLVINVQRRAPLLHPSYYFSSQFFCQVSPGSDSDSTSACPWWWSEGTLPAYWPVCKFDPILTIPSVVTSVSAHYLPLQWIAIAFWLLAFSVSFVAFWMFALSVRPLCSIVSLPFQPSWLQQAYAENSVVGESYKYLTLFETPEAVFVHRCTLI